MADKYTCSGHEVISNVYNFLRQRCRCFKAHQLFLRCYFVLRRFRNLPITSTYVLLTLSFILLLACTLIFLRSCKDMLSQSNGPSRHAMNKHSSYQVSDMVPIRVTKRRKELWMFLGANHHHSTSYLPTSFQLIYAQTSSLRAAFAEYHNSC